jgi:hypothetical protein
MNFTEVKEQVSELLDGHDTKERMVRYIGQVEDNARFIAPEIYNPRDEIKKFAKTIMQPGDPKLHELFGLLTE